MRIISILCGLIMLLFLNACLTYHSLECRIKFNDNFDLAHITITYHDLRSGEEKPEKQQEDFNDLVEMLQSDEFLLDHVEDGIYVKERKLEEVDGSLVGSYSGIFQELTIDKQQLEVKENERIMVLDKEGAESIETNGKYYETGQTFLLVWPKETKEIYWKLIQPVDDYFPLIEYYRQWTMSK